MNDKYILKRHRVYKEPELLKWAEWFEHNQKARIVKQEYLPKGEYLSTVFLGLDYNFSPKGKPLLFETMLFTSKVNKDGFREELDVARCSTWSEAEKQHLKMKENFLKVKFSSSSSISAAKVKTVDGKNTGKASKNRKKHTLIPSKNGM